jgi:cupin superfamily acireductone dioxygenase involved in methionine salvage
LDRALVIKDDQGKFKDVGDVVAIARAEGKKALHTDQKVKVIRLFWDQEVGWIAVVTL